MLGGDESLSRALGGSARLNSPRPLPYFRLISPLPPPLAPPPQEQASARTEERVKATIAAYEKEVGEPSRQGRAQCYRV